MMAIVQEIKIDWTKASRGFPNSARRNAVPDAFTIPASPLIPQDSALLEHRISCSEEDNFEAPRHTIYAAHYDSGEVIIYGCVKLELTADLIRVAWQYNERDGGAPYRGSKLTLAFELAPNQWGRVAYNGRFAEEGGWSYRKTILNLALVTSFDDRVFANRPPDFTYEQMAQLA